jgi:hypothetical protein
MGVDFTGYSNVKTEPLPSRFKPVINKQSEKDILEFEKELQKTPKEYRSLIMSIAGASYGVDGRIILPYEVKVPDEMCDEFYNTIGKEPDFIAVCWDTMTIYRRTPETRSGTSGRSYSGYGDFCRELKFLNNGPLQYIPPDTDVAPEYGFISTDKCLTCIQALDKIRHQLVSDSWQPDPEKYCDCNNARYEEDFPKDDDRNQESWFFREFYTVMSLGAESGFVRIH